MQLARVQQIPGEAILHLLQIPLRHVRKSRLGGGIRTSGRPKGVAGAAPTNGQTELQRSDMTPTATLPEIL